LEILIQTFFIVFPRKQHGECHCRNDRHMAQTALHRATPRLNTNATERFQDPGIETPAMARARNA
jgi:hypothetical protein